MKSACSDILIRSLQQNPDLFDHRVDRFEVIETHISWVLLTGPYAYKIKKPVDLGFVDFSTLEKRKFYCFEEMRLNPRLAPGIYLDVVPITGSRTNPSIGSGEVIEYAVKMKEFPQEALLHHALKRGEVTGDMIDELVLEIAGFHKSANRALDGSSFGKPWNIHQPVKQNFEQINSFLHPGHGLASRLAELSDWSAKESYRLFDVFLERKRNGCIRELHGDMHTGNMALLDGKIVVFDCIEFNESFHWVDVINDIAFFIMDLMDRGYPKFSRRVLNGYLEASGDYGGLQTLRYYLAYRAMVRAKVESITMSRENTGAEEEAGLQQKEFGRYVDLAESYARESRPMLVITHGVAGSGKTTLAQSLLEAVGAVRVRSDVERKRMFGMAPSERSKPADVAKIYSPEANRRTYERLQKIASLTVKAGYTVIVDAAFLTCEVRGLFKALACKLCVPFAILDFHTPEHVLTERVERRSRVGMDASEADIGVLEKQMAADQPLKGDELEHSVAINGGRPFNVAKVTTSLQKIGKDDACAAPANL